MLNLCRRILIITIFSLTLCACQTSPTGRQQIIIISDTEMSQLGAASFSQMKEGNPPVSNTTLSRYVNCLSTPLLIAASETPNDWEVKVFEDENPNAFALPGNKIGVNTGMIKLAASPGQLAAVIGHEIAHVQARHGAERVSLNMTSKAIQQAAAIAVNGKEYGSIAMAAIGLGAQYGVLLPYSRTHESEADYLGLQIMAKAGFDPEEAIALWRNMEKSSDGKPPEFMSTHPANATRIKQLSAAMQKAKQLRPKNSNANTQCVKPTLP